MGLVEFRDQHGHAYIYLRREALRRLGRPAAGPRRHHRLLQHLLVELDADLADVAGLLLAQQVAGTADVEVVAGELEAGTEAVQRLHHVQALLRRRAEDTPRRQREVGIAALLGTAAAAAALVNRRQAQQVARKSVG